MMSNAMGVPGTVWFCGGLRLPFRGMSLLTV